MFNWVGVTEFVAVAEAESFTGAANQLKTSTAQISRQISALETRLAVKLFYRTTRKVTITETGQIYYNHCRQVLDGLADAERAITDLHEVPRGRLKLTAPVTYGENQLAPLVNDFLRRYPELEINLTLSNQVIDIVAEGYDLAIRLGQLEDSSLMAKRLASRTYYVCASPDYLASQGMPHTLAELDHHNCLQGIVDYWKFQEKGKLNHIKVTGNLKCNSGWALVDAALKSVGIIQLPGYYVQQHLESGRLISILEKYSAAEEGVWAVYPQNRHLSPKMRLLLDHLLQLK